MTKSDHPYLESIGHVCVCLHTLGTHSPKTGACLLPTCKDKCQTFIALAQSIELKVEVASE